MARINTNTAAIIAGRQLRRSHEALSVSLERLSSGLRINRGADDPAGLIVSESLRAEMESARQAIANSQRAANVISTTEGALNEVASLLNDIQSKIIEAANVGAVSDDEIRANQIQIDSAIESITRIANTTTFAGRKLLNGSLGYITSGINKTEITDVRINGVSFGTASFVPVTINVIQSAQHAQLEFRNSSISQDVTLEISGPVGVTTLPLMSGTTATEIKAAINQVSDATGVSASFINAGNPASGVTLTTTAYGSDAFVQVAELGDAHNVFVTWNADDEDVDRDIGRNTTATVNGALALSKGLDLFLNTTGLSVELRIQEAFNAPGSTSFAIAGGGATFQLGPGVDSNQQVNIGVPSTAASNLGSAEVGFLAEVATTGQYALTEGGASQAALIVEKAIRQVAVLRGRLGAFEKNTLDTNIQQLMVTLENLTSSESSIRDLDFAQETSNLTRNQILVSAGTSVLAIANQTPQAVLALLQ
ncbi:MAG: flagellin [Phycisphaerae bacterium]|nr:flagellin [Phycisphaerae bacterium]